jgi:hypothetical protein
LKFVEVKSFSFETANLMSLKILLDIANKLIWDNYCNLQLNFIAQITSAIVKKASASGGRSPPDPLTRGFAPGPHWGRAPDPI